MVDTKPITLCAVVSLVCSILGCFAGLSLLASLERYGEIANRSAGVGIIWGLGHGSLAATLCLLGVIFGVVALIRIRSGECGGRVLAWTGIVLGCLPLAAVVFLMWNADMNPLR
jgi:hypothetical protein